MKAISLTNKIKFYTILGLLISAMLFLGFNGSFDKNVSCVQRTEVLSSNSFYYGNRKPLLPAHFIKLPLGSIKPGGWILKMLELQRDGLCGHLGEISAWLEKDNNAWLSLGKEHGGEEVPYWLRGYADMSFILDDPDMKKETMVWIEAILKS
jgi:hypothetical protein